MRLHTLHEWVFECLAGKVLLRDLRQHESHERLCVAAVLAGVQYAGSSDHDEAVRSMTEVGSSSSLTSSVLYTNTRALPDIPTQEPSGALAHSGTFRTTSAGRVDSIDETAPRPPGSCAKKTSAGEFDPSSRRVAAITSFGDAPVQMPSARNQERGPVGD